MHQDFMPSLKILFQKSGPGKRAGERAYDAFTKAQSGTHPYSDVFQGLPLTNNGENRIAHCRKFDLTGFARLITAYSNDVCIFLFAGDHDAASAWLEKNKGMDFVARSDQQAVRLAPVYVSNKKVGGHGLIESKTDFQSNGPVIDLLKDSYLIRLLAGLEDDVVNDIRSVESHTDEDVVIAVAMRVKDPAQSEAVLDVLLSLRSSDTIKAKNRIDQYRGDVKALEDLSKVEVQQIASSESVVRVEDVDPELFEHFVKTANFRQWMLYLHPAQRSIVERNFAGPARLAGVSGSGKTCVVIHRAVRLAKSDPTKRVLVLTLNDALARLIQDLVTEHSGPALPSNIEIKSIFQLCYEKPSILEPHKRDYYGRRTVATNAYVAAEHIDEIWDEYFHCQNNNRQADKLLDVVRTLLVRDVSPGDYLRQELDYVRSAFSPNDRHRYLTMDRVGRVIGIDRSFRRKVLEGLVGWESKMAAVGAIDDLGIVTALYGHLDSLHAEYQHTLVDEVQDLGTLELQIIRRITYAGQNDLFVCGDAAQSVQSKFADLQAAGIDLPPGRSISLKQNYRNSSQILTAAYNVLTRSFEKIPVGTVNLDILPPEFANFSSPNPGLLCAESVMQEVALALGYVRDTLGSGAGKKACIALCGYTQRAVEELGLSLRLPVLSDTSDIGEGNLFLSDLEQTKGFEFDLMIVLNCAKDVIPHPQLPAQEWFRDLCKLYVAMTRAKTELIVSYSGEPSQFLVDSLDCFNVEPWSAYDVVPQDLGDIKWPAAALVSLGNLDRWKVIGMDFLKLRDAIGLSHSAQDAVLKCVTGTETSERRSGRMKQTQWKAFDSFFLDLQKPRVAVSIVSDEVLRELNLRYAEPAQIWLGGPLAGGHGAGQAPSVAAGTISAVGQGISPPEAADSSGVATMEATLRVFKHSRVSSYSLETRSAYMLAVLLVAQGRQEVDQLVVGKPMDRDLLEFLLPAEATRVWNEKGWLRNHRSASDSLALTKIGWDECKTRIHIASAGGKDGVDPLHVDPLRIEAFRQTILSGPGASGQSGSYSNRSFSSP